MFCEISDENVLRGESFERKEIRKIKMVLRSSFPNNVEIKHLIQALKELHDDEVSMYKYFLKDIQ